MKNFLLLLVSFGFPIVAQGTDDFRLIGNTVYDFSSVDTVGSARNPFIVEGHVKSLDTNSQVLILTWKTVEYWMVPRSIDPMNDGPSDLLRALAQQKLAEKPMSAGQYFALSPEMRGNIRRIERDHEAKVVNFPLYYPAGTGVRVSCIPVPGEESTWDHGVPISSKEAKTHKQIRRVFAGAVVDEDLRKTFLRHLSQASNNMPYSQYLVGRDYREGKGVETNSDLADYWMAKAAKAGSPEAKQFLKGLPQDAERRE